MPPRSTPLTRARAEEKTQREAKRKHRQMCRTCTQFTGSRARWCTEGWAIEQEIRAAQAQVKREEVADPAGPGLW